jgi:hypothetical protein
MSGTAIDNRSHKIPAGVWAFGFVSLLMDVSSEMIHSLPPLFLVTTLGASAATVGLALGSWRPRGRQLCGRSQRAGQVRRETAMGMIKRWTEGGKVR